MKKAKPGKLEMREPLMRVVQTQSGKVAELGCPYCNPPVHIEPGVPCKTCGAQVVIYAVRPKGAKFVPYVCKICNKSGGSMKRDGDGWKHDPSCLLVKPEIMVPV